MLHGEDQTWTERRCWKRCVKNPGPSIHMVPQHEWFPMKNPFIMDNLGVPQFRKPPHPQSFEYCVSMISSGQYTFYAVCVFCCFFLAMMSALEMYQENIGAKKMGEQ